MQVVIRMILIAAAISAYAARAYALQPGPAANSAAGEPSNLPVTDVAPIYPIKALFAHIAGSVLFDFTIDQDGSVSNPTISEEAPSGYGFGAAAKAALIRDKFLPRMVDGKPVARRSQYRINFTWAAPQDQSSEDTASTCPEIPRDQAVNPPSSLPNAGKPTNIVRPHFPPCAELRQSGGVVDVEFTLMPDGSITDLQVVQEVPSVFGFGKAVEAVFPKWKFSPMLANGVPTATRARYRFNFSMARN